jgi:methyltransferase (TIGR00027 family)
VQAETTDIVTTDNDSWNLATSVGLTATEAAAARAVASRRSAALIDDPFAEPLVRAVGVTMLTELAQQSGEQDSGFAVPRLVDFVAARTRFFDDYFTAAHGVGIRQVVILGAGLDARAYRLNWPAGTTLYEIDQPEVIEFKTATLAGLGIGPKADRRPVAADLRGEWPAALDRCGFDPRVPTVWSAEGLIPYVPPDTQDRLLDGIHTLSASGSWLAADTTTDVDHLTSEIDRHISAAERCREGQAVADIASIAGGGQRQGLPGYMSPAGWSVSSFGVAELFESYGLSPLADGEQLYRTLQFHTAFRAEPPTPIILPKATTPGERR